MLTCHFKMPLKVQASQELGPLFHIELFLTYSTAHLRLLTSAPTCSVACSLQRTGRKSPKGQGAPPGKLPRNGLGAASLRAQGGCAAPRGKHARWDEETSGQLFLGLSGTIFLYVLRALAVFWQV